MEDLDKEFAKEIMIDIDKIGKIKGEVTFSDNLFPPLKTLEEIKTDMMLENLKCCGNCGNEASCWNHWQYGVCDSWIYDEKTKEDRENE